MPEPEPELVWYDRDLVGFENWLKDEDQIKDKIAESLAVKGRTVTEASGAPPGRTSPITRSSTTSAAGTGSRDAQAQLL